MNKAILSLTALLPLIPSLAPKLMAAEFSDNFNRSSDVALTPLGSQIGTGWNISSDYWSVENTAEDGYLSIAGAQNNNGSAVVWNEEVSLHQNNGQHSSAQVDALAVKNNTWAGLAFNVQDSDTFYQVRFKTGSNSYQIVMHDDGKVKAILSHSDAITTFEAGKFYQLRVELGTDGDNSYHFTISEPEFPTKVLNPDRSCESTTLTGGYAGVTYGNWHTSYHFDNFHVKNSE